MTSSNSKPWNLSQSRMRRRTVLKGMGAGALAAMTGAAAPHMALTQVEGGFRTGWTHLVGGGGTLLFYNQDTGEGLAGTIDNSGWHEGERYSDFSQGWSIVVSTSQGSVLMVDPSTGQGAGGVIEDGAWSYLTDYSDFSEWTHAVATSDSVLFYNQDTGQGAGGTLIDGAWSYLTDYPDFATGYTHLTGNDNSILLYDESTGYGATGTLIGGEWEWISEYNDFSTDWALQVGSGDSLLLVHPTSGAGAGGILEDGAWEWTTEYVDFSAGWTHVASAGNGFVLFYDAETGLGAWGTLQGGAWEYYGNPIGEDTGTGAIEEIDELAIAFLEETAVPGLSIAIAKDGNLVYAKGYGLADPDTDEAVTTDHRFRIASVSKPITSAAIMRLVEDGQLNLDDLVFGPGGTLADYGTMEHDPDVDTITIEHLLTHTGGGWSNAAPDPMYEQTDLDADELITWVLDNLPLDTTPGTNYAYSNFGYCALGRVIEHTTGQSYDEYVQGAILDPSSITTFAIAGNTLDERQENEVVYDDANTPASFGRPYEIPVSRMDAHGGWVGTATDLLRFATRVDGFDTIPDILDEDSIDVMTTPSAANPIDADPGYAMGWNINGANNWWHNGNLAGTESFLVRSNDGICWAALANGNGINLETLVWGMIERVDEWPDGEPL